MKEIELLPTAKNCARVVMKLSEHTRRKVNLPMPKYIKEICKLEDVFYPKYIGSLYVVSAMDIKIVIDWVLN